MNKGDTLRLNLNFEFDNPQEIELQLNPKGSANAFRFTLTDNTIKFDEETQKYYVELSQEDTFKLGNRTEYQVRVKKDNEVHSSDIYVFSIGNVLSTEVL